MVGLCENFEVISPSQNRNSQQRVSCDKSTRFSKSVISSRDMASCLQRRILTQHSARATQTYDSRICQAVKYNKLPHLLPKLTDKEGIRGIPMHLFAQSMAKSTKLRLEKLKAEKCCTFGRSLGCVNARRAKITQQPEPCTFGIEAWSGTRPGRVASFVGVEGGRSLSLPDTAHLPPRSFPPEKEEKWTQRRGSRILSI